MIRLIAPKALPPSEAARGRWLSDPDLLLRITEELGYARGSEDALVEQFSLVLHDLRMAGTWKRTSRGRLPQTEKMLISQIVPDIAGETAILDLGASDGTTTLELAGAFRAAYDSRFRLYLADVNLYLLRFRKGPLLEYRAANGEPIMARVGPFGLRLANARRGDHQAADPLSGLYLASAVLRRSMRFDARIPLVNPLVACDPAITVIELDCLVHDPLLSDQFLAVRASNVLNLDYFAALQIHAAITNVHAYLRDGGCFLVSRNHDEVNGESEHGSIWRKAGRRFVHIADFGEGSEIKTIISEWAAP